MKKITKSILFLTSAVCLSSSQLSAVTTDPVGYVTETLRPASFNLIGQNLSAPVSAAGTLEGVTGNVLTDDDGSFTSSLDSSSEYFVKITSGTSELGLNTGISSWTETSITTDDDLSAVVGNGATYEIRRVQTIADLFGENNSVELAGAVSGDTLAADIIWVPTGGGDYSQIYYNATARAFPPLSVGWKNTTTADQDASDTPVYFTNGILIQIKRGSFGASEAGVDSEDLTRKDLVFAGSVQTDSSQIILETNFNYVSRVFPSGVSLADSGLESSLNSASAGDTTGADIIWVPDGSGGYNQYYYNGTPRAFPPLSVGWKGTATADADASTIELESGFIIQRKGGPGMATINIPESVSL